MADPEPQSRSHRERERLGDPPSPFEDAATGPPPADEEHHLECVEWCPICRTADVVRATAPPEIRDQWQAVQREALMTVRALIDTYLDRIEGQDSSRGPTVEEIRIE